MIIRLAYLYITVYSNITECEDQAVARANTSRWVAKCSSLELVTRRKHRCRSFQVVTDVNFGIGCSLRLNYEIDEVVGPWEGTTSGWMPMGGDIRSQASAIYTHAIQLRTYKCTIRF